MVRVVERVVVLRCGRVVRGGVGRRSLLSLRCCYGEVLRCGVMRMAVEMIRTARDCVWAGRRMRVELGRHGEAGGANVGHRAGLRRVRYGSDGLGGSVCT